MFQFVNRVGTPWGSRGSRLGGADQGAGTVCIGDRRIAFQPYMLRETAALPEQSAKDAIIALAIHQLHHGALAVASRQAELVDRGRRPAAIARAPAGGDVLVRRSNQVVNP